MLQFGTRSMPPDLLGLTSDFTSTSLPWLQRAAPYHWTYFNLLLHFVSNEWQRVRTCLSVDRFCKLRTTLLFWSFQGLSLWPELSQRDQNIARTARVLRLGFERFVKSKYGRLFWLGWHIFYIVSAISDSRYNAVCGPACFLGALRRASQKAGTLEYLMVVLVSFVVSLLLYSCCSRI